MLCKLRPPTLFIQRRKTNERPMENLFPTPCASFSSLCSHPVASFLFYATFLGRLSFKSAFQFEREIYSLMSESCERVDSACKRHYLGFKRFQLGSAIGLASNVPVQRWLNIGALGSAKPLHVSGTS